MQDRKYTKEEAYALDRDGQFKVLSGRGISAKWNWKEATLVNKILQTNPEDDEQPEPTPKPKKEEEVKTVINQPCPRCNSEMRIDGYSVGLTKYICDNCGRKISK